MYHKMLHIGDSVVMTDDVVHIEARDASGKATGLTLCQKKVSLRLAVKSFAECPDCISAKKRGADNVAED